MNELILGFQNTQDAIAAERKLLDAGMDVELMPAPKAIKDGGICLAVHSADIGKVRLLLGNLAFLAEWRNSNI